MNYWLLFGFYLIVWICYIIIIKRMERKHKKLKVIIRKQEQIIERLKIDHYCHGCKNEMSRL